MKPLLKGLVLGGVLALVACAPPPSTTTSPSMTPASATATPQATPSGPETMTVTVYFSNSVLDPGASDCAQVYALHREVPAASDVLTATLTELLAGPTAAEAAIGYESWFSPETAQALVRAKVTGNTSYVDLTDLRTVIPNASTSCGSASLLAQLRTTAQQAGMTPRVLYAINGQPATFWEWLQRGCDASNDNCDPAPFAT